MVLHRHLATIVTLSTYATARAHDGWGHMMNRWHMTGWGGWLMMIFWIILLAVAIYFMVRLFRGASESQQGGRGETPMDILKRRYANGEISKEEFEEKKKELA